MRKYFCRPCKDYTGEEDSIFNEVTCLKCNVNITDWIGEHDES